MPKNQSFHLALTILKKPLLKIKLSIHQSFQTGTPIEMMPPTTKIGLPTQGMTSWIICKSNKIPKRIPFKSSTPLTLRVPLPCSTRAKSFTRISSSSIDPKITFTQSTAVSLGSEKIQKLPLHP